ncbi:MAG: nucleoside kinase [Anaerofustis sp.]
MIPIRLDGRKTEVPEDSKIIDLIPYSGRSHLICGAYVNNIIKSLEFGIKQEDSVRLIDITDEVGMRIYFSTLLLIFSKAAHTVFPEKEISISYSLGGGIYCEFKNREPMTQEMIDSIRKEMAAIIERDIPLKKLKIPWREAYLFMRHHKISSATNPDLMVYVHAREITLYEMDDFYGYYYSKMLLNSKDVYLFDLIKNDPGCVIMAPDRHNPAVVRKFEHQHNLHQEFQKYEEWCARLDVSDVVSLNRKIENKSITNLITVAEARHEDLISNMAYEIARKKEEKRIVLIAGPSSSGKTTTSKRLRTHLIARELNPIAISLDNYFLDREHTPKDENGEYDFESIDAIDIELFNENLIDLMEGREVEVPIFDFVQGKRMEKGQKLKVAPGNPIIIEGIHGLNDKLTWHIPRKNKYKIYINDLTHLNIDPNNRIPTSDVRLIRRIVRDSKQRGNDALKTISMWQSVKRGEEKNIYPFSDEADFVFNSSLFYEMSVLKKYAEPALQRVKQDSLYYAEARRMIDFLSFFLAIEDESAIYSNSILREFIGGNIFDSL